MHNKYLIYVKNIHAVLPRASLNWMHQTQQPTVSVNIMLIFFRDFIIFYKILGRESKVLSSLMS